MLSTHLDLQFIKSLKFLAHTFGYNPPHHRPSALTQDTGSVSAHPSYPKAISPVVGKASTSWTSSMRPQSLYRHSLHAQLSSTESDPNGIVAAHQALPFLITEDAAHPNENVDQTTESSYCCWHVDHAPCRTSALSSPLYLQHHHSRIQSSLFDSDVDNGSDNEIESRQLLAVEDSYGLGRSLPGRLTLMTRKSP
jgi:hypothetical protein